MLNEVICGACGSTVDVGAKFCGQCGQPVGQPAEERRVVTVLFADIVGYTAWSERADPESVKHGVEELFEVLARDVVAFGGRVDKIVGDAIIALFGAPVAHEDDAERAVRAGLQMQETLRRHRERSATPDDDALEMRIGINTGEVLVGALKAGGDYTAMGDVMNTASRLQAMASPGTVLVGETTFAATETVIRYNKRGRSGIRGRSESVATWEAVVPLGAPGSRAAWKAPLVGRSVELRALREVADASLLRRRAQVIIITGDAGVGKSRVAWELAGQVVTGRTMASFVGALPTLRRLERVGTHRRDGACGLSHCRRRNPRASDHPARGTGQITLWGRNPATLPSPTRSTLRSSSPGCSTCSDSAVR